MPSDTFDPSPIGPSTSVTGVAAVPLETAWDRFVPIDLPRVFPRAQGPIPPVIAVEDQTGRWDTPGRSRKVILGDGSSVREEITLSEPSDGAAPTGGKARFGYTVSGFANPLGLLTTEARGFWTFVERDGRTSIEWSYAFRPTGLIARPLVAAIVATFWRRYMRDGMANVLRDLERTRPSSGVGAR